MSQSHAPGALPAKLDQRSRAGRRLRALIREYEREAWHAGILNPTIAQQQLIRRCAALSLVAEGMEAKLARGEAVDTDALVRTSTVLARLVGKLGIGAKPKPTKPESLEDLFGEDSANDTPQSESARELETEKDGNIADFDTNDVLRNFRRKKLKWQRIKRRTIRIKS